MLSDTAALLALLARYSYLLLFPLALLEGPVVAMLAGVLVAARLLNGPVAYLVIVLADLTGDSVYYLLGRWGRHPAVAPVLRRLGGTAEHLERLERALHRHGPRAFLAAKLSHFMVVPFLVATGVARLRYPRFLAYDLLPTLPKSACFLVLGVAFGGQIPRLRAYLDVGTGATVALALVLVGLYLPVARYRARRRQQGRA
jgi:membrane-associated protein